MITTLSTLPSEIASMMPRWYSARLVRHWPGSALASELSRRLASAQSLIESSGGGFRIESDFRTVAARRSGPIRVNGGDDRRRGELVERLADRCADLVADPGNRRLLVAERRQPVGQHQQPGAEPGQHRDPRRLDRLRRQEFAAASVGLHLGEIGLGLDSRARSTPKSGAPACARTARRAS